VVLLVEDDPGDQELTRRALDEAGVQADLRTVQNGDEAMAYLLRHGAYSDPADSPRPRVVLLDLNMPRVNGRQVLRRMRSHPELGGIPVVVLTTSEHEKDVSLSYELGCVSFVVKPLDAESFGRTIRELSRYWLDVVTLPGEVEV
jgi:CheY-like chemotaxis protein